MLRRIIERSWPSEFQMYYLASLSIAGILRVVGVQLLQQLQGVWWTISESSSIKERNSIGLFIAWPGGPDITSACPAGLRSPRQDSFYFRNERKVLQQMKEAAQKAEEIKQPNLNMIHT